MVYALPLPWIFIGVYFITFIIPSAISFTLIVLLYFKRHIQEILLYLWGWNIFLYCVHFFLTQEVYFNFSEFFLFLIVWWSIYFVKNIFLRFVVILFLSFCILFQSYANYWVAQLYSIQYIFSWSLDSSKVQVRGYVLKDNYLKIHLFDVSQQKSFNLTLGLHTAFLLQWCYLRIENFCFSNNGGPSKEVDIYVKESMLKVLGVKRWKRL